MRSLPILAIGSLMLILFVAGCGGGGGGSIDKTSFVEQANQICQETAKKMRARIASVLNEKPSSNLDKTNLILMRGTVVPAFQSELKEIRALGIPSEGGPEVQAFLRATQQAIEKAETQPTAFFESRRSPFETAELAATKYGVTECPVASAETS